MNRMLASTLSAMNALLALVIVLGCLLYGATYDQAPGELTGLGAMLGLIAGVVAASTVCGLIAFMTLIERHLNYIAVAAEYQNQIAKIIADRST